MSPMSTMDDEYVKKELKHTETEHWEILDTVFRTYQGSAAYGWDEHSV